jgi:hypothetical protein
MTITGKVRKVEMRELAQRFTSDEVREPPQPS